MDLDRKIAAVAERKDAWARLPIPDRIALARRCIDACVAVSPEIVSAGCHAKGLHADRPGAAEEWLSGPVPIIRNLRLLIETLSELERTGHPRVRVAGRSVDGALIANVFPRDRFDAVLYSGTHIDVWMQYDISEATLPDTMAVAYRSDRAHAEGCVALVLGAGNVASIGPMDLLYKLFVENHVVIVKMHPINAYLAPLLERAFAPIIDAGYLQIACGDVAEGQYLVHHPSVDEVHITGSAIVHDRIVWGDTPDEQAERRANGTPKLTKRITSELGCVTPVVVVPGHWSSKEIDYQAENVATMVAHNASCNCNAAKLLVTWRGWKQRRVFLDRIETILSTLPQKRAYYPGSAAKHARFVDGREGAKLLGVGGGAATLPYAALFDVAAERLDDPVFCEEAWSPVLAETALAGDDERAFLEAAVRFCNERVAGTLSAALLVDPHTRRRMSAVVERAVADLRYGTVAVNHWSAVSYALAVPPWGAYPGHTLGNVGSGIGVVHNTLMFDRPLKTVLWAPFTTSPKPVWFCTHRRAHVVAARMAAFEASPSWLKLPPLAIAAMRP